MENNGNPLVQKTSEVIVDGNTVNENPAALFRGLGCVSGNNSSRLLMDYKMKHPDIYQEILRQLFEPGYGASLSHLKLEFGADINSSSGTEPCVKRTADEIADVHRGAGFMLAADAKKVNPGLTLDLLRWGEPNWVTAAFDESQEAGFQARYQWFYETLVAAYETYGLKFDYLSPDANETDKADTAWLIYFSNCLKTQENPPYDFSSIKLVASDEVGSRTIAQAMLENEALRDAIDVIGLHYTTYGDDNTQLLHDVYGKEIWYSEGIAPCNIPELSCRVDGNGMSGSNGPIDVANRIINSYAHGHMVMYEFQPAIAAYYDGACYSPKQLMTANTPWSGHYTRDIGFWIASHFTRFTEQGWNYVDSACFGDGEENHAIWNTTHNYLTLVSPDRTQLTMHFSNDSDSPRSYLVIVTHLPKLQRNLRFIETAGNDDPKQIDRNWFKVINEMNVHAVKGDMAFPVVVKPHSLLTITTMDVAALKRSTDYPPIPVQQRLPLPYHDDFAYVENFLLARGSAPLYTTDQGGAFEVVETVHGNVLQQMITKDILPTNWRFRGTPDPITCLGDDQWANYQCSAKVLLATDTVDNYAAIGLRYNSTVTHPESAICGFLLRLYADGKWEFCYMEEVLQDGFCKDFQWDTPHTLHIMAIGDLILAFIDGDSVEEFRAEQKTIVRSGRVCLQSAYYHNQFLEVKVDPLPLSMPCYCWRIDCLAPQVQYLDSAEKGWMLNGMASYQCYHRTCAVGEAGSALEIRFYGCGVHLYGRAENAVIKTYLDGKLYAEHASVARSDYRECFHSLENLPCGWHTVKLLITEGSVEFDVAEIPTDDPNPLYSPPATPVQKKAETEQQKQPHPAAKFAKAAIPIAGIAATGLAVAFTVGAIMKKRKGK